MLSEEEEQELENIIEDVGTGIRLSIIQIGWLIDKLKETNDELKEIREEIAGADRRDYD